MSANQAFNRRRFVGLAAGGTALISLGGKTRAATGPIFAAGPGTADATPAARAAAAACRGTAGQVIALSPGEYHFADPEAVRQMETMLASGKGGDLAWGGNNQPFQLAFDFIDCEDLTLDGQGSTLIMHGLLAPLSFRNCRRLTLKNFAIDWDRPLFTSGRVVRSGLFFADFEPGPGMPINGGEPAWAWQPFNPDTLAFGAFEAFSPGSRLKKLRDGRVRITHPLAGKLKPGDGIMVRHMGNFRPGIHLFECDGVTLENVSLRANPGMGITSHRTRDVLMRGITVEAHPGRVMSLNTDALHFISCRGRIVVEDSKFSGMGDDGINVHGFYQTVKKRLDDRTLLLTLPSRTQDCMFDHPDPGDRLEICRRDTLAAYAENEVETAEASQERWEVKVRLSRSLPADFRESDVFVNVSQLPRLTYRGNRVGGNRARSVLCQTRGVMIEGNEFIGCTGTGVHINTAGGTPGSWWETGGTRDVTVRGNRIIGCGYGPGCYLGASAVTVGAESQKPDPGVHRDLIIADNEIECAPGRSGIHLADVTNVRVAGNKITGTNNPLVTRPSVRGLVT